MQLNFSEFSPSSGGGDLQKCVRSPLHLPSLPPPSLPSSLPHTAALAPSLPSSSSVYGKGRWRTGDWRGWSGKRLCSFWWECCTINRPCRVPDDYLLCMYYIFNLIFLAYQNSLHMFVHISVMMSLTTLIEVAHVRLEKDRRKECPVSRTVLRFLYSGRINVGKA